MLSFFDEQYFYDDRFSRSIISLTIDLLSYLFTETGMIRGYLPSQLSEEEDFQLRQSICFAPRYILDSLRRSQCLSLNGMVIAYIEGKSLVWKKIGKPLKEKLTECKKLRRAMPPLELMKFCPTQPLTSMPCLMQ